LQLSPTSTLFPYTTLFRSLLLEGTFGSRVLVLVEGEVAILKRLGAAVVELARQQPVVFLGEMALVEGGLRSATVRAVDRCKTLEDRKSTRLNSSHVKISYA